MGLRDVGSWRGIRGSEILEAVTEDTGTEIEIFADDFNELA